MPIAALDHIVLNVADIERALAFYHGCLGLPAERVEGWRNGELPFPSVRINPDTLIDLVRADGQNSPGANLNHFCLVTDEDELTAVSDRVREAGVRIEQGPAIRSGARGDAVSIYFRDPDNNLIEVRTYARGPLIRLSLDDMRSRIRSAIDSLADPDAPLAGNEAWTRKDLIAHLVSVEGLMRQRIEAAMREQSTTTAGLQDVDAFNAEAIGARRGLSLQQLRHELDEQAAATAAVLARSSEADFTRTILHPQRGPMTLADRWLLLPRHARTHLAELRATTPALAH